MPPMTMTLDDQMEQASEALAMTDYLTCEQLCIKALAQAKAAKDWAYYGRILLPLQESRRQRRMIAADAPIRLGTSEQGGGPALWLEHLQAGCVVVTHPHSRSEAARLLADVRERNLYVEVLFADTLVSDKQWQISSPIDGHISILMAAPDPAQRDQWLAPGTATVANVSAMDDGVAQRVETARVAAANWFIEATQKLGDAWLATVKVSDAAERITALEACIDACGDHEILHQRLADAAKAARLGSG